jgi:hypothetical protein
LDSNFLTGKNGARYKGALRVKYLRIGVLILALALPVTGSAASPGPVVQLSAASLTFGNQATGTLSPAQSVTITNTGDAALTIANTILTGSNPGDFIETIHCGVFVVPGGSCSISVVFNPSASGSRMASLVINDNAGDSPQTIALSGTGTIPTPLAVLSPIGLSFGSQMIATSSAPQTIILSNNGTSQLHLRSISIGGPGGDFQFSPMINCPGTINVNASCQIYVTFKPTGPGTRVGLIQIMNDSPDSPQKITVTGTGTVTQPAPGITASSYHVFPQIADGYFADGSYFQSTLLVTNSNPSLGNSSCTLLLRGLALNGQTQVSFTVGTTFSYVTPGKSSALQTGYTTLQCSSNVEAQLVYSLYTSAGTKISEATVFSSPPASMLRIVADNTGGSRLGLAIANDSSPMGFYTIRVYDVGGNLIGAPVLTISGGQNRAVFLDEILTLPQNYSGYVDIVALGSSASVIGLKFTGNIFSTVPAAILGPASVTANTYHIFPQIADGYFADGSYFQSTLVVTNVGSGSTNCTLQLHGMTVNGQSQISFLPGAEFTFVSPGNVQAIQSGYASLQCASKVEAQLRYSFYSPAGTKRYEATVFSSLPSASLRVAADYRGGSRLGIAVANDSSQSAGYTLRAYDAGGNVIGSANVTVGGNQNRAAFLDELVTLPNNYYGYVDILGNTSFASVVGLSFTANTVTTVPAVVVGP